MHVIKTTAGTKKVGIYDMLRAGAPPADDTTVVYGISRRGDRINLLHSSQCINAQQTGVYGAKIVETLVLNLQQDLKNRRIDTVCRECLGLDHEFAGKLVSNARMLEEGAKNFEGTDRALLLYCEAWKPGNVNDWVDWLYGETPDQIREKARSVIGWAKSVDKGRGGEHQMAYFDAYGFNDMSWVIACGDHVSVPRALGWESSVAVHGLLPANLWKTYEKRLAKIYVPVECGFTKTHLELAVSLYEEGRGEAKIHRNNGARLVEIAEKSVETAMLCLA